MKVKGTHQYLGHILFTNRKDEEIRIHVYGLGGNIVGISDDEMRAGAELKAFGTAISLDQVDLQNKAIEIASKYVNSL